MQFLLRSALQQVLTDAFKQGLVNRKGLADSTLGRTQDPNT
jgi:hypothetical protein